MNATLPLTDLPGVYILTGKGLLGYFNETKTFVVDEELSRPLTDYLARFVQRYTQHPDEYGFLIALIHRTPETNDWSSPTIVFPDAALHKLYPAGGGRADGLTDFQKRNRTQSVFHGLELLLDYRIATALNVPAYCPVLFHRHTTLKDYAPSLGFPEPGDHADLPVLEVVNLFAAASPSQLGKPEFLDLHGKVYDRAIRKDARKRVGLAVVRDESDESDAARDIFGIQAGENGETTRTADEFRFGTEKHQLRTDSVNCETLRFFEKFRSLSDEQLDLLCKKCELLAASGGQVLARRGGTDDINIYLLEGTVELEAADGGKHLLEGGSAKTTAAIASLKPRQYTVTAFTPIKYYQTSDAAEAEILSRKPRGR